VEDRPVTAMLNNVQKLNRVALDRQKYSKSAYKRSVMCNSVQSKRTSSIFNIHDRSIQNLQNYGSNIKIGMQDVVYGSEYIND